MKVKSVLLSFLIVCLVLSLSFSSYALPVNVTLQEKAEFLETLRILVGTNGDFRLNEKLTRAEAATFAVRVLGQEYHVLLNAETYKKASAKFPDVETNLWYAPYVGYCTQMGFFPAIQRVTTSHMNISLRKPL